MKKLFLGLVLFASANVFACPGGKYVSSDGQVTLTADMIVADFGMGATIEKNTQDAFDTNFTFNWSSNYLETHEGTKVTVAHVEKDDGGVMYTVYKLEIIDMDTNAVKSEKYIKVSSNYAGNGLRARGESNTPKFPIAENYGC